MLRSSAASTRLVGIPMTTPHHLAIRSRIATLLKDGTTLRDLREFYEWFVPATWQFESTGEEESIRLTNEISHLFSEFSAGDLTAAEVMDGLAALAMA
jgi:hypothetical protein